MEKYYANTLIMFLKLQQELGYVAIEEVLGIIDNNLIPEIYKRDLILSVFRKYGLNELTSRRGRFIPQLEEGGEPIDPKNVLEYHVQTIRIRNGYDIMELVVPLN